MTYIVRIHVQRPLGKSQVPQSPPHEIVAQGAGSNVATLAGNLRRHIGRRTRLECSSRTRVNHSLEWACTIGRHNVHGAADTAARRRHLRKSRARHRRDLIHHVDCILALTLGLAQAISRDVGLLEDSGILLSLAVGASTGDYSTLNAEGGGVATCITSLNWVWSVSVIIFMKGAKVVTDRYSDLAVGRYSRRQGEDDSGGMHFRKG